MSEHPGSEHLVSVPRLAKTKRQPPRPLGRSQSAASLMTKPQPPAQLGRSQSAASLEDLRAAGTPPGAVPPELLPGPDPTAGPGITALSDDLDSAVSALIQSRGNITPDINNAFVAAFTRASPLVQLVRDDFGCYHAGLLNDLAAVLSGTAATVGRYARLLRAGSLDVRPNVFGVLARLSGIWAVPAKTLTDAAAIYAYSNLPAGLTGHLPGWLSSRLPEPQPREILTVLDVMRDLFRVRVGQYARLVAAEAAAEPVDVAGLAEQTEQAVMSSRSVGAVIARRTSATGLLQGHLEVLGDASFTPAYLNNFHDSNRALLDASGIPWRVIPVRNVDNEGYSAAPDR